MKDPKVKHLTPLDPAVLLPDGTPFATWEAPRTYHRTYHVAGRQPLASDENVGSESLPWKTIGRAARELRPGERVVVHEGVYRETVEPLFGGEGPSSMIGYFAAEGERVIISGAEIYSGPFTISTRWKLPESISEKGIRIYEVSLPREWFIGFLPFGMINMPQHHLDLGWGRNFPEEPRQKLFLKRGLVFQDGRRLKQVLTIPELENEPGSYWCEENGLIVHIRPFDESDPQKSEWQFTTRAQAFAPKQHGTSFIEISGIEVERCADSFTWPQHAAISAGGGTHWIIENNTVRDVNANGIDLGNHHCCLVDNGGYGFHIVRKNRLLDCGLCGICATARPLSNMLVEENHIVRAGWHAIERLWESAGIKQHLCLNGLYRRNLIEDCLDATGIWLDNGIVNTRVTQNLITRTRSVFGGVFIEASKRGRVMVDHNIVIGSIKVPPVEAAEGDQSVTGGHGIYEHDTDRLLIAHNLVAGCEGTAVMLRLGRVERFIEGRGGVCRGHQVLNNLILDCGRAVEFGRPENQAEGNVYAGLGGPAPFRVHEPVENMDFEGWCEFLGHDLTGELMSASFEYESETHTLTVEFGEALPLVQEIELAKGDYFTHGRAPGQVIPGPFAVITHAKWSGNVDPRLLGSAPHG